MTSGWPKSLLLLCCSTFVHVILYFPRAGHHLKENKRRTRRASLLFPAVFNAKGHIQTKLSTFRAWSFSPYIYYKFALGTKPIKWSCPAGTAHWMFTLKQNNCPLSFHHMSLPCWMIVVPLSLPVAIQCTVSSANGGIPWWRVWTVSPVRLQHVATATANMPQTLTHVWDFAVLVNKN